MKTGLILFLHLLTLLVRLAKPGGTGGRAGQKSLRRVAGIAA